MYQRVLGSQNLARDITSNAIINLDLDGYKAYVASRDKMLQDEQIILSLKDQMKTFSEELSNLKALITQGKK